MLGFRIVSLLLRLCNAYELLIIIDAVLSWVPVKPGSFLMDVRYALNTLTEPFVGFFRNLIPGGASGLGIDFSPVVALLALQLIERLIVFIL